MDEGDLDFSRELICPKTAECNMRYPCKKAVSLLFEIKFLETHLQLFFQKW